jgi:uncharacterized protein (DUF427 family)
VAERLRVVFAGMVLADAARGFRVLETSHPPTYYLPPEDIRWEFLAPAPGRSLCEFKGLAAYWTIRVGDRTAERAAWGYPDPTPAFAALKDHLAFYAGPMDGCWVGEERAEPQPGGFYGGWVTSRVVGPFKGGPGTMGW